MEKSQALLLEEHYRLESRLAHNQVETWKAQCLKDNTWVVVKILNMSQLNDWKTQELFEREAKVLKNLNHPALPCLLDSGYDSTHAFYYLIHNWVEGRSLDQVLENGETFSEEKTRNLAEQILEILSYLHRFSPPVVHRDLKPSNLIWDGEKVSLVDFGGVLEVLNPQGASTVTGTYGYMAPEQFAGKAVPASDIYSLGATLLTLLTGKLPSEHLANPLQMEIPEDLELSFAFRFWLEQMIAYQPQLRFQSAQEALMALQKSATQQAVGLVSHPAPKQTQIQLAHSLQQLEIKFTEPRWGQIRILLGGFGVYLILQILVSCLAALFPNLENGPLLPFLMITLMLSLFGLFFLTEFVVQRLAKWAYTETELNFKGNGQFRLLQALIVQGKTVRYLLCEEGKICDILAVKHVISHYENKKPKYKLSIEENGNKCLFGIHLSEHEQIWLQAEILAFLSRHMSETQAQLLKSRSEI